MDTDPDRSGLISGAFNTTQQVGNALALAGKATLAATISSSLSDDGLWFAPIRGGFLYAAARSRAALYS